MDKKLEEPKIERPLWSTLPVDMLISILERLRYEDRIRFHAVCKGWRSDTYGFKRENKLPWLMTWNWEDCLFASLRNQADGSITTWCNLYDPIRKQKTIVERTQAAIFVGSEFCDAKDGWVLFSKREVLNTGKTTSFFFYNPFTTRIIKLSRSYLKVTAASFTTTPDSPDCLIFTYSKFSRTTTSLGTYSPRRKTWKRIYFAGYHGRIQSLIYIEGVFYCAFARNVMGSFNLVTKEWKTYRYPMRICSASYTDKYLLDFDGMLLLASDLYHNGHRWSLYLFDDFNWRETENLDNGLLLASFINAVLVPVSEETSDLRNEVLWPVPCVAALGWSVSVSCRILAVLAFGSRLCCLSFGVFPLLSSWL
ncbi:hypothetical protein Ddye_028252 [Dipteronia dyeriana]|uniref:F-box domain-containing protein n=1 Tax=Dipteronia dyeriana TaxID=168575 RepID=A0AAD9WS61_9ROSI|nr:hypothetical protein Ddye_028252 [Dipteronia dyeriana]